METRSIDLEELPEQSLAEFLRQVAESSESLRVRLDDGKMVSIVPGPQLDELPILAGHVPNGWKDAIYGD